MILFVLCVFEQFEISRETGQVNEKEAQVNLKAGFELRLICPATYWTNTESGYEDCSAILTSQVFVSTQWTAQLSLHLLLIDGFASDNSTKL